MNKKEYSIKNCPQSDTWFVNGGRCGWAWNCEYCKDNPDKEKVNKENRSKQI